MKKMNTGLDYVNHGSFHTIYHPIEKFDWFIVSSGHGNKENIYIQFLQNLNWNLLMGNFHDPMHELIKYLSKKYSSDNMKCGCSISMCRVFANRCELWNIGSTQSAVFINGMLQYMSSKHTYENNVEYNRVRNVIFKAIPGVQLKMIASDALIIAPEHHCLFFSDSDHKRFISLEVTQIIGYGGVTGIECEQNTFLFSESDHVRILLFSNGVSKMMTLDIDDDIDDFAVLDVDRIVDKCYKRWRQEWNVLRKENGRKYSGCWGENDFSNSDVDIYEKRSTYLHNYEDISLGIWDNQFIPIPNKNS